MFKFALKIIIFLFPVLILLAITEYKARSTPNNFALKRAILEKNIGSSEVIITGASHAFYGIKPSLLGIPAVSIAYPGQDIYYDTRILLRYLPQAEKAKFVIISISYPSFHSKIQDSIWSRQISFYRRFWEINHESPTFKIADYSAISLFGMQQSREFLLTGKVHESDEIDESGNSANLRETNQSAVINGHDSVKRHELGMKTKYVAQNVNYLNELLDILKIKGIPAIIITIPCFHTYYDNFNAEQYARMQQEIQELNQKYGLPYANYLKDSRFTIEDFQDSDHLNSRGMEKFSYILRDEVVKKYVN